MKFKTFLIVLSTLVSGSIVLFTGKDNFRDLASTQSRTFPDFFPDTIFFSLKNDLPQLEGPVERQDDEGRYMKRVFGLIIQAADKAARKDWYFPKDGVYETYNYFLLNSLIVPYHESRYVHLRERQSDQCSMKTNGIVSSASKEEAIKALEQRALVYDQKISEKQYDLDFINEEYKKKMTREENQNNREQARILTNEINTLKKEARDTKALIRNGVNNVWNSSANFKKLLGQKNPFPGCDEQTQFKQLLFSYDYNDVGIMMFNMKANPGPFERGTILSTNLIISEGVNLLYNSYNRNASDYKKNKYLSCFQGEGGLDYMNLIRGTWSNYNGGHFDQRACRFVDSMNCLKNIYGKYTKAVANISENKSSADDKKIYNDYNYAFQKDNKALIKLLTEYETNKLDGNVDLNSFACRFKENDWHYLNNVVEFFHKEDSYMHKYLPQNSLERQALDELVSNIKNKTNKKEFIDKVLATNYKDFINEDYTEGTPIVEAAPVTSPVKKEENGVDVLENETPPIIVDEEGSLPLRLEGEHLYIIKGKNVNLRYSPDIVSDNKCGNTGELQSSVVKVELVDKNIINGFYKVRSPLFQELSSADCAKDEIAYVWADFIVKSEIHEKNLEAAKAEVHYGRIVSGVKVRNHFKNGVWTGRILSKGTRVIVLEKIVWGDLWYRIVTEDGQVGWVWQNVEME